MCVIGFEFAPAGPIRLTLAANRDEFFARPTAAAHWWPDAPGVFGGRDGRARGGWLLAARNGRIAALTNVRQGLPDVPTPGQPSRGALVADFVAPGRFSSFANETAVDHARRVAGHAANYAGFNLLLFDFAGIPGAWFLSNRPQLRFAPIEAGIHVISNGGLDDSWPKMSSLRKALADESTRAAGGGPAAGMDRLLCALTERSLPDDAELPDTGVGVARERLLAPVFVAGDLANPSVPYGTRSSSVIRVADDGRIDVIERSWNVPGAPGAGSRDRRSSFRLDEGALPAGK